ncbi:MAG: PspC domain-containing protein [Candidatus Thorarchaeota archaeon]|nr:MAG: PspC domain-containing protein [Candidatus Thorarchaeota archaeon]
MPSEGKKLFRSKKNRVLAGVCGGIAEYLGVDPTIVRLLWVLFTLLYGAGLLGYIIAILIIPEQPQ